MFDSFLGRLLQLDDYLGWNKNTNTWGCLICQRDFSQKNNAIRHLKTLHCENEKQQCHICYMWSKNELSLRQHFRDAHKGFLQSK